jgi:hypothetical protein
MAKRAFGLPHIRNTNSKGFIDLTLKSFSLISIITYQNMNVTSIEGHPKRNDVRRRNIRPWPFILVRVAVCNNIDVNVHKYMCIHR